MLYSTNGVCEKLRLANRHVVQVGGNLTSRRSLAAIDPVLPASQRSLMEASVPSESGKLARDAISLFASKLSPLNAMAVESCIELQSASSGLILLAEGSCELGHSCSTDDLLHFSCAGESGLINLDKDVKN